MLARRTATLAAAALGLGLLAGCERPLPEVGAYADGEFFQAGAALWCFEGQAYLAAGSCREEDESPTRVDVRNGAMVMIEVPQQVKERGWFVRIVDGQTVVPGPVQKDKSVFRISPSFPEKGTIELQVVALPEGPGMGETSGFWEFTLVDADVS